MARLSLPIDRLRDRYDVVVVGSGYGGGIAASRLARAGRTVCVLERGKEFQPGEYPDTPVEALSEMQVDLPHARLGKRNALYDFRVNEDINVFQGCGLGGTSLVNANVALRVEPRVFEDARWPAALREDSEGIDRGYARAEEMLKPVPFPETRSVPKLDALRKSARRLGLESKFSRPPIAVNFEESGDNHVGVEQSPCNECGDCVTGCNVGAKNTVLMNYLPDARNFGAEIFTETEVQWIERAGDHWVVHFFMRSTGQAVFEAPALHVRAATVVLGAGSLGSTEILLRSKAKGLALSDQVGQRFTGNGDVLAFGYNNDEEINGIGFGAASPKGREKVGPCITGIIDARQNANLEAGMVIEEGSIPGALSNFFPGAMGAAAAAIGEDTDEGWGDAIRERARVWMSQVRGAYHGATRNTQTYLVMSHDDAAGRLVLENDRLRIRWPGVGEQPRFRRVNEQLRAATAATGGTFVQNPIWTRWMGHRLVTVHPLGGCPMGEDAKSGVVNDRGQVFAGKSGNATHDGLYVCDGAVMPRSLGVNPFLTICALAERTCERMADEKGWSIDYSLPSRPRTSPEDESGVAFEFTETMRGFFQPDASDYEAGYRAGRSSGNSIEFTLTVATEDLDRMLEGDEHAARMAGTLTAPFLSDHALQVSDGNFHLLVEDPDRVGAKRMEYSFDLTDRGGRKFHFDGFKSIRNEPGLDLWADTTTLFITVREGHGSGGDVVGRGKMIIEPLDFMRQLTTMRTARTRSPLEALEARAKFGTFFAGSLFETYGGMFAGASEFDPDAPPRKKRALAVGAPEVHPIRTEDGVDLRLTRYSGGRKGPVLLSHGLGVSSKIFSLDTIDQNLLEFLYQHGYDVWLFDYRASIDLPSSHALFSGDDIARYDYPAAVDRIRQVTGHSEIDVVAHCFGSTTFFMAMLAGLEGVRSIVASQVAMHCVPPPVTKLMSGLHVPTILSSLGVESLTAYVDRHASWTDRLFDTALELYPLEAEERCRSKVCHRISFLYSLLYEHDQLNKATHDTLHELFGVANIRALEHLTVLCRAGHLVDLDDREVYMPHLDRLALPITFISGAENHCFLPESTEKSYLALRQANDGRLYSRHLIGGYGHIDCIFGKKAAFDVYPIILSHLDRMNGA